MATWTAPSTAVTGALIPAAYGNSDIRDNTQYLYDEKISRDGSIAMTGDLVLAGNPNAALEAAPKQYVDTMLPLAGGTMSGTVNYADQILQRPLIKDYGESLTTNATSGAAATLDLENGNVFDVTLTDNCTFTLANPPATGKAGSFTLILRQDGTGSRTATWPASVKWTNAEAATLSTAASSIDILTFTTIDGGTTWFAFQVGQGMA